MSAETARHSRMRDVFIEAVTAAMRENPRIFYVVADFGSPKLDALIREHPARFLNVGIAEQNLINVAVGLSLEGFTVFAYAIAPFLSMRCYEQTRVSLAMLSTVRQMHVTLVGVGAGFSYDVSGPTHQSLEDLTIMRALPNVSVASPPDAVTARALAGYCLRTPGIRYLRLDGKALPDLYTAEQPPDLDRGFTVLRPGHDVALVATGYMTHKALAAARLLAARGMQATVVDMLVLKPFDEAGLAAVLRSHNAVLAVEEGFSGKGGLDSLILHLLNKHHVPAAFHGLGIGDRYDFTVGARDDLLERAGLNEAAITKAALRLVRKAKTATDKDKP